MGGNVGLLINGINLGKMYSMAYISSEDMEKFKKLGRISKKLGVEKRAMQTSIDKVWNMHLKTWFFKRLLQ